MRNAFPLLLAILDIGAAVVYAWNRDWPRVAYWICAAGITASTLFIK